MEVTLKKDDALKLYNDTISDDYEFLAHHIPIIEETIREACMNAENSIEYVIRKADVKHINYFKSLANKFKDAGYTISIPPLEIGSFDLYLLIKWT